MARKYSEKEILDIIESGSLKNKERLYLRDRMGYFGTGFILDNDQIDELHESIEESDRQDWDRTIEFGLRIENGFRDINTCLSRIGLYKARLLRLLTEVREFEVIETELNKIFRADFGLIALPKERVKKYYILNPNINRWGAIDLGIRDGSDSLIGEVERVRDLILSEYRTFCCYDVAMRKRIKEIGLNIPEYIEKLDEFRKTINDDDQGAIPMTRFVGVQDNRGVQIGECNLKDSTPHYPYPALRGLIEDYSVRLSDINTNSKDCKKLITDLYNRI